MIAATTNTASALTNAVSSATSNLSTAISHISSFGQVGTKATSIMGAVNASATGGGLATFMRAGSSAGLFPAAGSTSISASNGLSGALAMSKAQSLGGASVGASSASTTAASSSLFTASNIASVATIAANLTTGIGASRSAKKQAREYEALANQMELQSAGLLESAGLYAQGAAMAKEAGQVNAREITRQAGTVDAQKQLQIAATNIKRRSDADAQKTTFAAQGILLESRAGSAVAMWEQDDAADAVLEKLNIMQLAEDRVYDYLVEAKNAKIKGLYEAAQQYGSASQTAGQAQEAMNKAIEYRRIASRLRKSARGGLVKSIASAVAAAAVFVVTAGAGAPISSALLAASATSTVGSNIPT